MNGCKGVGFCLEDGSMYGGNFELMICGEMQTDFINLIDCYRESPLVQKAITDMKAILSGQAEKIISEPDQKPEVKKASDLNTEAKKEPEPNTNAEAKRDTKPSQKPRTEKSGRQGKTMEREPLEPEKRVKMAPQTDNGTMNRTSRKQSVLNALREHQDKMRKQNEPEQKATRRKGEQEL